MNLLSFGEEEEEEENELVNTKIRSSHDVLDDPRLLKGEIHSNDLVRLPYGYFVFDDMIGFQGLHPM